MYFPIVIPRRTFQCNSAIFGAKPEKYRYTLQIPNEHEDDFNMAGKVYYY